MMNAIQAVLFDLDGTLLDTANDIVHALNRLRGNYDLAMLTLPEIRPMVGLGSKVMLKYAFDVNENDDHYLALREQFFAYYQENIAEATCFFPDIENVLTYLDQQNIPWGIVTNKLTMHTQELLKAMRIHHRAACIVCGDSLRTQKPNPEPILHACQRLQRNPANCVYIGDAASDVIASRAAGTKSLVALYGYIHPTEDPLAWQADGYIHEPMEIIEWLRKHPAN